MHSWCSLGYIAFDMSTSSIASPTTAKGLIILAFLGAIALLLVQCKSSTLEPNEQTVGYTYFPIAKGQYRIYKVDEVINRYQQPTQRLGYLVKELIGDTFTDPRGEQAFRLYRYKYQDTARVANYNAIGWQLDSLWSVRRAANTSVRTENNIPYLNLIFPVREGSNWNVNQYNQFGTQNPVTYRVRDFGKPYTLHGINYPKTLRVSQYNDFSCLGQDQRFELYADGVGLIFKSSQIAAFNPDSCLGKVIQGRSLTQTLIATGNE